MLENDIILQRLKERQLLSEVVLMLASTMDIQRLFRYTLDATHALLDIEHAAVLFPDENQENLVTQAESGHLGSLRLSLPIHDSPAGQAYRSKETVVIEGNILLNATHTASVACFLPMNAETKTLGVLAIYGDKVFAPPEISLVEKLTTHAAFAIQNARSREEIELRSFELALIIDATEAVNSTLDLPRILSLIGKNLLKALHVNWSEIITYTQGALSTLAVQREAWWLPEKARAIPLSDVPLLEKALHSNQPVALSETAPAYAVFMNAFPRTQFFPVSQEGKSIGLLQATSREEARPPSSAIMQNLARAVSDGEWRRGLSALRQGIRDTGTERSRFWLWRDEQLKLVLDEGGVNWMNSPVSPTRDLSTLPTFEGLLLHQDIAAYAVNQPDLPEDVAMFMEQEKIQVLMVLPLVVQDNRLGLVLAGDTMRNSPFGTREITLAHALVLQAANAIKNAQLYNDLQLKIEELRQTQAKLVQTARLSAIGELAAAVAHQINNPLTTVLGDTELVLTYLPPDDPNRESLQAVHRAGQRAHHVVKRLLGMARQKPDDDVVQLMDINATIMNTMDLIEGTFQRSKMELQVDLAANLPPALGMPGQLEDVWLNLLLNARDAVASQEERQAGIRTSYLKDKNAVRVEVWDNGPGFGDVDPSTLFDAFYTTKPPAKGTGLGLYICKNIVERCHGTITAVPGDKKGAVFVVTLSCEREAL